MSSNLTVDLAALGEGPIGERATRLFGRTRKERIPIAGGIELTHRCNLACVHCYVNLPAADRAAQRQEMTTEQVKRVIDEIVEAGALFLTITGGEPLLRPDFAEIYLHAHGKGLVMSVYTNATLITERIVDLWVNHPPRVIEITQYGFTPETYDRVVDAGDGQYARFRRGLERLLAAGVRVSLKAIAMKANKDELLPIRDFAKALGLRFRYDTILSPRIDGGKKPLQQRLSPNELVALELSDEERNNEFASYCERTQGHQADDLRYHCGAGLATFTIDPYGRMHVCELSRRPGWDVVNGGFQHGWDVEFPALRAQKRQHTDGCGTCGGIGACGNCAGMAELEGRSNDDGNLYMCEVSNLRMDAVFGPDRHPTPNGLVRLRASREGRAL